MNPTQAGRAPDPRTPDPRAPDPRTLAPRAYRYGRGARSDDSRPLIALDVDGVIALDDDPIVPAHRHMVDAGDKWRREITVADATAALIATLAGRCEIAWASAWSYNAHDALRDLLLLPETPWTFLPVQFNGASVVSDYADGRPWAWITEASGPVDAAGGPVDPASGPAGGPASGPVGGPVDGIVVEVDPRVGLAGVDTAALLQALGLV